MGKISGNEYVKYLTERMVEYIEEPKESRLQKREKAKAHKEQWLIRWFGAGGAYLYYLRHHKSKDDE